MLQSLEQRRLLSTLSITGTIGNDLIKLQELTTSTSGSTINVMNVGTTTITVKVDTTAATLKPGKSIANTAIKANSKITSFGLVDLQAGNDSFVPATVISVPMTQVLGGDGNDTITGSSQADLILPGTGDDIVSAREGNDTVRGDTGNDSLDGGTGDDLLQDDAGNDTSLGGDGNDTLTGYEGSDSLVGGAGNDEYLWGSPAAAQTDTVVEVAGGGTDTLDFEQSSTTAPVSVNLGSATLATQGSLRTVKTPAGDQAYFDHIIGTPGNDHLIGNATDNVIDGGDGKDTIEGGDDNDTLFGGAGNDTILGGNGNDSLLGQDADDSLAGGAGDDFYVFGTPTMTQTDTVNELAGGGSDMLDFGTGATAVKVDLTSDTAIAKYSNGSFTRTIKTAATGQAANFELITGSKLGDTLTGNSAANTIYGAGGNDTILGGAGNDSIDSGSGNDSVNGNDGNDSLSGAIGNDTLHGDAGNDLVIDYNGSNKLFGDAGDDIFVNQNRSVDTLDGGDGFDSAQQDSPADIYSNVEYLYDVIASGSTGGARHTAAAAAATTAPAAVTAVIDSKKILRISGTNNKDSISVLQTGTALTVTANGKTFNFSTTQLLIASGKPSIVIEANGGDDTVSMASSTGAHAVSLITRIKGGDGNDSLTGGTANDAVEGDAGNDTVNGGLGNDVLSGDYLVLFGETPPAAIYTPDGNDKIIGGGGDSNVVSYSYRTGAVTVDISSGTAISGGKNEKDTISGVSQIIGGQAADVLIGSAGTDILFGGQGNDTMTGGRGNDFFFAGLGADSIKPDSGNDFIDTGNDNVTDTIVGKYDTSGDVAPTGMIGNVVFIASEHGDFFSLSKTTSGN